MYLYKVLKYIQLLCIVVLMDFYVGVIMCENERPSQNLNRVIYKVDNIIIVMEKKLILYLGT